MSRVPMLAVPAALLELACCYLLWTSQTNGSILLPLGLHLIAALLSAQAGAAMLPDHLNTHRLHTLIFIGLPVLLLPLLGMVGLWLGVLPALKRQKQAAEAPPWKLVADWRLPERAVEHNPERGVRWAVGLSGSLQNSEDAARRSAALIGTLSLHDELAVPMLRRALKDPEDEVRLLAYALLNRKEKSIEQRIAEYEERLEHTAHEQQHTLRKALANAYWQLARLGIPRGSTQMALLAMAREQAQLCLQHTPEDAGLHFLLGQILLYEGNTEGAAQAFELARARGVDPQKVSQQLAEVAFRQGDYAAVRQHLQAAGAPRSLPGLHGVREFWDRTSVQTHAH